VNSRTLVGRRPVHATALAISYACTHSDSVPYMVIRRISPPIQADIRHVGRWISDTLVGDVNSRVFGL